MRRTLQFLLAAWIAVLLVWPASAAEPALRQGDLIAICGDSITEQRQYSVMIEDYLLMCQPVADLRTIQFGWSGETAQGFLGRMDGDCLVMRPTVATTCYGMNDGAYRALEEPRAKLYRDSITKIVQKFKQAGVRLIIVGSPGVVDMDSFRKDPQRAATYNATLAALRDVARDVAKEQGVVYADVYDPMMNAMIKAKDKLGHDYIVAGRDGIHPADNGHLIMAYAFLRAMGCDGEIGTLSVDLAAQKADGTPGHKVISFSSGALEVESSRYPFCFTGRKGTPNSTRDIIEFFPFNEELNRFRLVVSNAEADRVNITWGRASRQFAAADLAKGINLAAEFPDNPFGPAFARVDKAVREKQAFETPMVKSILHSLGDFRKLLPDQTQAIQQIQQAAMDKQQALAKAAAAEVKPVRYTIRIQPLR